MFIYKKNRNIIFSSKREVKYCNDCGKELEKTEGSLIICDCGTYYNYIGKTKCKKFKPDMIGVCNGNPKTCYDECMK